MSRKPKNRSLPKRILILCEGESEQIYLNGVKKSHFNRFCSIEIEVYKPNDFSPLGLTTEARKRIKTAKKEYPYFSIWIVFDKDTHKDIDQAFNISNQTNPKINIAFSNISFEYWILLHFEQKKSYFPDSKHLIKYIEKTHKFEYSKTMNIYEALKNKTDIALKNCDWLLKQNKFELDSNLKPYDLTAYTDFHQLYRYLVEIIK